jgi:hypothetical protein
MDAAGTKYRYNFQRCAFTNNVKLTGWGRYNIELDRFVLRVQTTGRWTCDLQYVRRGERITITGKCNGKPIRVDRADQDRDKHQMPDLNAPKHDS